MPKKSRKGRIASRLVKVLLSIVTVSLMTSPMAAAAETSQVVTSGAGKVSTIEKLIAIPRRAGLTYITYREFSLVIENAGHPLAPVAWFIVGYQIPSTIRFW